MSNDNNNKKTNNRLQVGDIGKAAVKGIFQGAQRGGGLISAPFRAVQTGINSAKGISRGLETYNKNQQKMTTPKKQPQQPKPKQVAKPISTAKPNNVVKPKPVAKPQQVSKPKAVAKPVNQKPKSGIKK